jgi:hypothetical protein
MNHQNIAVAKIIERRMKLRPVRVLATCFIRKLLVELRALKLTLLVLINARNPHVPNALTAPRC